MTASEDKLRKELKKAGGKIKVDASNAKLDKILAKAKGQQNGKHK